MGSIWGTRANFSAKVVHTTVLALCHLRAKVNLSASSRKPACMPHQHLLCIVQIPTVCQRPFATLSPPAAPWEAVLLSPFTEEETEGQRGEAMLNIPAGVGWLDLNPGAVVVDNLFFYTSLRVKDEESTDRTGKWRLNPAWWM